MVGPRISWHVEHRISLMPFNKWSGHCNCLQKVTSFADPGCPKFLWSFSNQFCSSALSSWNSGPCFWLARSMTCCGGSSSRLSWWVTSVCDWLMLLGFIWGLHGLLGNGSSGSFVLGSSRRRRGALGFIASANTGLSGRSLAGPVVGCEDAAKMVKLTRAGVPFFRRALLDKASHDSHSSAWTVPVCRLMQICLRSGAAWAIIGLFGPTYLSVPLHKTTCLMLWSGHICWTNWMISPCSTTRVPTRGAVRSAQDMTVCQLISAGSLIGLSLDGLAKRAAMACGLSFMPNRRRLVGCSSSPAKIGNCGGWSCMMIFPTCLANFWG